MAYVLQFYPQQYDGTIVFARDNPDVEAPLWQYQYAHIQPDIWQAERQPAVRALEEATADCSEESLNHDIWLLPTRVGPAVTRNWPTMTRVRLKNWPTA